MRIQHNITAMNAYRNYSNNTSALAKNLEKLSSGYKINRAGDDAAGLAISEKMRAQITGLETAQKNAKDGISLVQTAEGALTEVHDMLNRMYELAEQSANGTYDDDVDRYQLQKEVNSLRTEINRISKATNFNGINLLDGSFGLNSTAFEIGTVEDVAAVDGAIGLTSAFPASNASAVALHVGVAGASKSAAPSLSANLTGYKITASSSKVSFTVSLGSQITIKVTASATKGRTYSIGSLIAKASKSDVTLTGATKFGSGSSIGTVVISSLTFSLTLASTVKLTYLGQAQKSGAKAGAASATSVASSYSFTAAEASAINAMFGSGYVTVTASTGTLEESYPQEHAATVVHAVAKGSAVLPGIDFNLGKVANSVLQDGNTLTIGSKTFVFKIGADSSTVAATGQELIDLSNYEENGSDLVHAVVDKLSEYDFKGTDGSQWMINVAGSGTIHIDMTTKGTQTKLGDWDYDALVNLFSADNGGKAAKYDGNSVTIASVGAINNGDALTIDGTTYTFGKNSTGNGETYDINLDTYTTASAVAAALANLAGGQVSATSAAKVEFRDTALNKGDAKTILGKGLTLQIGDTADDYNQLQVTVNKCDAASMGIGNIDISTQDGAIDAMDKIKNAINYVSDVRGTLGATQNRLDHTINNLSVMQENIQDAESTIRDVDVAEEMMEYTKNSILVQSAQAMLAQANQLPQGVLQLLQ